MKNKNKRKKKAKATTDAVKILHNWIYKGHPERLKGLQKAREQAEIAGQIYKLRTKAGLTQAQLAKKVGTTQSVISRLEDADYSGHSLYMLRKIAHALDYEIKLQIVPQEPLVV